MNREGIDRQTNETFAERIRDYWRERGRTVETAINSLAITSAGCTLWAVRSDMRAGWPTGSGRVFLPVPGPETGPKPRDAAVEARRAKILAALARRERATAGEIAGDIGESYQIVRNDLARLARDRRVTTGTRGVWLMAPRPERAVKAREASATARPQRVAAGDMREELEQQ